MTKTEVFAKGDIVRLREYSQVMTRLAPDHDYEICSVADLENPDAYYVDPRYWDTEKWSWAKNKTRLDLAGHSQVIQIVDVFDAENNPCSFSGAWLQKAS